VVEVKPGLWMMAGVMVGCSGTKTTTITENISIDDFHGFASDAAWSYRDDGVLDEPPEDGELLRARYVGNGILDIRRGTRWADASRTAEVQFFLDDMFSITGWELGEYEGSGDLPLGKSNPVDGQSIEVNGWFCMTNRKVEVETYYGWFPDVIQFECDGSAGPEGLWTFAKDLGLVSYEGPEYSLSLVAPW
jgi:hypothetical protein